MKKDFPAEDLKKLEVSAVDIQPSSAAATSTEVEGYFVEEEHGKPVTVDDQQKTLYKYSRKKNMSRARNAEGTFSPADKLQNKRTSWKGRLLRISSILILGVMTGAVLGTLYKNSMGGAVDFSGYTESQFRDDTDELLKLVTGKTSPTEADKQNWVSLAKDQGITDPTKLTPSQNFMLAEYNSTFAKNFFVLSLDGATTAAGMTQTVYSRRKFNGSKYTFESLSVGSLVQLATCSVTAKGSNKVEVIQGNNITETNADWTGAIKPYTVQGYKDTTGTYLHNLSPYIVSSKTVLNNEKTEVTLREDGNYEFTLKLDPVGSVINYVKQIEFTSGMPVQKFNNVTIRVIIDQNWNFVETNITESYGILFGGAMPISASGHLKSLYYFNLAQDDENLQMPV